MATQPKAVQEALHHSKRFEIESVPVLVSFVKEQATSGTFDLEANIALLKLYQFYPQTIDRDVIATVLLKALMNMPTNDFLLCSYLVPEKLVRGRLG
jgi:translation initiation factor 3 subunit K